MGNDHPSIAPYGLFRAADRELVLAVGNDRQFETLCNVLGAAELAVDERFVTNADRVANRADLVREFEARLLASPAAAWASALIELGVPAGVVNDVAGAFALAESIGLDPIVAVPRVADAAAEAPAERAGGGTRDPVRLTRNPIGLSRTPAEYRYCAAADADPRRGARATGYRRALGTRSGEPLNLYPGSVRMPPAYRTP